MKILITNDDGIDAEGLAALETIASEFGDVVVVAPRVHHSGCSHQLTWEGHLDVGNVTDTKYWVDGFPTDCVRIGISELFQDVDVVISGINHGGNLGLDVYLSGTVAAAREAMFMDFPAIAISQYHRGFNEQTWPQATAMARRAIEFLMPRLQGQPQLWSVNLPTLAFDDDVTAENPEIIECKLDLQPLPLNYQKTDDGFNYVGDYHDRPYASGTDVDACFSGHIAVTRL